MAAQIIIDHGAIDARFAQAEAATMSVVKDIGRIEGEVKDLRILAGSHSTGLTKAESSIKHIEGWVENIAKDVNRLVKTTNMFLGGLVVVNLGIGAIIAYIVKVL